MNIGNTFITGPKEAAYVVNDLLQARAVIASHANEEATREGRVRSGTRTAEFTDMVRAPVHVPLSGRSMSFDGDGRCVVGCS